MSYFWMEKVYPLNQRKKHQSRNSKIRKAAEGVIRDFVNNTSIHGIKYLQDRFINSGPRVKFFWTCTLILAFIGSALMLQVFWNRYRNNPMLTVIESFHIPSFRGTFPALTVCPMVPPHPEMRLKMLRQLRLPESMSKKEAVSLLKNAFELTHPRSDQFQDQMKINQILDLNGLEMLDLLKSLRGPCKDVVESCWWDEKRENCEKLFRVSYSYGGLCCSFNYDLEDNIAMARRGYSVNGLIPTAGYGSHSGLTLVFKKNQFISNNDNGTISRITTNTIGLMLFIHHPFQYPDTFNLILQAGREMQLGIVARGNIKEQGVSRKDETPCAMPGDLKIKYFPNYDVSNCQNSCRMRAAMAICGCVPWLFAPFAKLEGSPLCGFMQMKCLRQHFKQIWSVMYVNTTKNVCFCPESCLSGIFVIKHTEIPIASSSVTPSMIYHNISAKNAVLRLFMAAEIYENMGSIKITNEIYMLSSVGGIFSLFLGCSILSICEVVYFCLILIISCLSIVRSDFNRWLFLQILKNSDNFIRFGDASGFTGKEVISCQCRCAFSTEFQEMAMHVTWFIKNKSNNYQYYIRIDTN